MQVEKLPVGNSTPYTLKDQRLGARQFFSSVGECSKLDFLSEQNQTDDTVKWPRTGGHVNFVE